MVQIELNIKRAYEPDRNADKGGRSFYFFDFDDNVAFLTTKTYLFHKETQSEIEITSRELAEHGAHIGKRGPYRDFRLDYCDETGSFRNFRDKNLSAVQRFFGVRQSFVRDLASVLGYPDFQWKGPSWSCFYHAVFNQRPTSIITARGHHPETIKEGFRLLVKNKHLPHEPNYHTIIPVSHPRIKSEMGMSHETPIAHLKRLAIRKSVMEAFELYGYSPHHRFGMSDDDPVNLKWITEEMVQLKEEFPENSFYVIETHRGQMIKHEVFSRYMVDQVMLPDEIQLNLF